jgi:hypothetical protein
VYGENTFGGFGAAGRSLNCALAGVQPCTGVRGEGQAAGVTGLGTQAGSTGVAGTGSTGVIGDGFYGAPTTGVLGTGTTGVRAIGEDDAGSTGVYATSDIGTGVRAFGAAIGVEAGSYGTALKVDGRASFSRSGRATISAGAASVIISGVALEPGSIVLATLQQGRAGTWIRAAVPNATNDTVTILLNKAAPAATKVAWFVVELP